MVEKFLVPVLAVMITIIGFAVFLQVTMEIMPPSLAALAVALAFGFFYLRTHKKLVLITSIVWGLYVLYELEMWREGANIRVDIFLVWPILFVLTAIGIGSFLWSLQAKRR